MTNRFGAGLLLTLAVAFSSAAYAQDATAPTDGKAANGAPLDLSAGQPVKQERPTSRDQVQQGQLYVPKTSGDWEVRCARAPEGQDDPCQMYQLLRDSAGTPTAEFTLFRLEGTNFEAGALIVTPLETLLTRGVSLTIDAGTPKRYPLKYCSTSGCVAEVGFTADDIAAMKRGNKATISIVPMVAQNSSVDLTLSLSGFTALYNDLPPRKVVQQ